MKKTKRFIFDTDTSISSSLFSNSVPRKAVNLAIRLGTLAVSLETYEEFREIFTRPKFDKYLSLTARRDVIDELKTAFSFHEVSVTIIGDKDLLALHPFSDIPIPNAADFLNDFSITPQ